MLAKVYANGSTCIQEASKLGWWGALQVMGGWQQMIYDVAFTAGRASRVALTQYIYWQPDRRLLTTVLATMSTRQFEHCLACCQSLKLGSSLSCLNYKPSACSSARIGHGVEDKAEIAVFI